jgi:hypothetical protein
MFDKPLPMNKNKRYTIKLKMAGPNTFTGESFSNFLCVGGFLRVLRFPSPIKLTATI